MIDLMQDYSKERKKFYQHMKKELRNHKQTLTAWRWWLDSRVKNNKKIKTRWRKNCTIDKIE